ncbi:hypothetical protein Tco_0624662 [Tanacetum coccineum]|uniref:Uncharacterized protein n=1 Tax=Tanacetum coccineum TaxID=301880 RepID=A0ABQ4WEK0_9ASTR
MEYGRYGVSKVLDTAYRRHKYAVSSLMDTAYWLSEQGLKPKIRNVVRRCNPKSIWSEYFLAKWEESSETVDNDSANEVLDEVSKADDKVVIEFDWNEDSWTMKNGVNYVVVESVQGVSQFNHPDSSQSMVEEEGPEADNKLVP